MNKAKREQEVLSAVTNEDIDKAIDVCYRLINGVMNSIDRARLTDAMKLLEIQKEKA